MIVKREYDSESDDTTCWIFLTERPGEDFKARLLSELLAMASPAGLGHVVAFARRGEDLDSLIRSEIEIAGRHPGTGRRRRDDRFNFDYVSGYRVKVWYYPKGLNVYEDSPPLHREHEGMPAIFSSEFEEMYGHGGLEGAVLLALNR